MGSNLNVGSFQVEAAATNVAQPIEKPSTVPGSGNPQITSAVVRAMKGNAAALYVGGSGVTAANGFELAAGDALSVDVMGLSGLYFYGKEKDKVCVMWVGS